MKATPHIITDMLQCCLPSGAARLSPLHYVLCLQAVEIKGSVLMPKSTWQPGHRQGQWHSHALPGHLPSQFIGSKRDPSLNAAEEPTSLRAYLFIHSFFSLQKNCIPSWTPSFSHRDWAARITGIPASLENASSHFLELFPWAKQIFFLRSSAVQNLSKAKTNKPAKPAPSLTHCNLGWLFSAAAFLGSIMQDDFYIWEHLICRQKQFFIFFF